jgi:putative endonuclease
MDRREIGNRAEDLAARHLIERGATVLLRNYRRRLGELDLVAQLGETLLIVEVRTRSSDRYGGAAASVDFNKQRRIVRAAQQLLQERKELARLRARFDVIAISDLDSAQPRIDWIEHAFVAA